MIAPTKAEERHVSALPRLSVAPELQTAVMMDSASIHCDLLVYAIAPTGERCENSLGLSYGRPKHLLTKWLGEVAGEVERCGPEIWLCFGDCRFSALSGAPRAVVTAIQRLPIPHPQALPASLFAPFHLTGLFNRGYSDPFGKGSVRSGTWPRSSTEAVTGVGSRAVTAP